MRIGIPSTVVLSQKRRPTRISSSVSVSTSTTEATEATEKIPMFWLGALGVLGGDGQTEPVRNPAISP
jgi:hypothetical protein